MQHSDSRPPSVRPRRRSIAAVALVSTAAMLALSSCSATAAGEGDQSVLTVYGWKGSETEPANMEKINAAFEKAHPEIDLQFEAVPPNDTYTQRVQPELLAGDSADVIMTDSSKVQTWGSSGYLADLGDSAWTEDILPEVDPFVRHDDTVYALPMEIIGIDLYANRALLAEAGVEEIPTTWPKFEEALTAVKDAGITPLALPNKSGWTGASTINAIAATRVYQENPDWDADFLAGDASFSDWTSSVEQFLSLDEQGLVDFSSELGVDEWAQGLPDFTSGKSAFWVQGAWNQTAVADAGVDSVFVPWPGGDEGQEPVANLFVGTMWSITEASDNKEAAQAYLDFWADAENAAPFVEAENAVTPFSTGTSPSSDATADFVAAFEDGRYRIMPSNTWLDNEGEKAMQIQTQSLMLGDIGLDEYLDSLDEQLRPAE